MSVRVCMVAWLVGGLVGVLCDVCGCVVDVGMAMCDCRCCGCCC